jgi:conflict system pore-forming effector with SLATT domain/uncharacterized protein DUF4231
MCMGAPVATAQLTSAWEDQSVWSQAADRLKRALFRTRMATLLLTIAAAGLVTVATYFSEPSTTDNVLAGVAAGCATLAALLQAYISPSRIEDWMRARSVSESLKAETYKYLAGTAPYRGDDRASVFQKKTDDIRKLVEDVADRTIGIDAKKRELPAVSDVNSYAELRVRGQAHDYYRPKSAEMKSRATMFRSTEIVLIFAAAALSAVTAASDGPAWAAWIPVVTTISAAVAAEAAVQRYSALAVEYARTNRELDRLLRDRTGGDGGSQPSDDDRFVENAERVISLQNEAWMARGVAAAKAGFKG